MGNVFFILYDMSSVFAINDGIRVSPNLYATHQIYINHEKLLNRKVILKVIQSSSKVHLGHRGTDTETIKMLFFIRLSVC